MPRPNPTATDELLRALTEAHRELEAALFRLRRHSVVGRRATDPRGLFLEHRIAIVERAIDEVSGKTEEVGGKTELPAMAMADLHLPAMRVIAQALADAHHGLHQTILRRQRDAYQKVQARFTLLALAKGETGGELSARFVREFVKMPECRDGRIKLPAAPLGPGLGRRQPAEGRAGGRG